MIFDLLVVLVVCLVDFDVVFLSLGGGIEDALGVVDVTHALLADAVTISVVLVAQSEETRPGARVDAA